MNTINEWMPNNSVVTRLSPHIRSRGLRRAWVRGYLQHMRTLYRATPYQLFDQHAEKEDNGDFRGRFQL